VWLLMSLFDVGFEDIRRRKGRKWTRFSPDVIPLWIADSDFHVPPQVKNALVEAIQEEDLGYGNDSDARGRMAEKIRKKNGINVDPEVIYVTQGVLPAMWLACKYACRPGDEAVVTDPCTTPSSQQSRLQRRGPSTGSSVRTMAIGSRSTN